MSLLLPDEFDDLDEIEPIREQVADQHTRTGFVEDQELTVCRELGRSTMGLGVRPRAQS